MDESIGAKLKMAREDAGVSLSVLAKRTNYTRGYLSNIENGRRRVTPDIILAYERALGDDVNRRSLLTNLAVGVVAPLVMSEALHEAFAADLGGEVSREEWQGRLESYGRNYMLLGPTGLSERLVSDMIRLQQHRNDPAIWSCAARLMVIYGKTLPIDNGAQEPLRWYRLATMMADRSQDLATRVWVRGSAALALAYDLQQLPMAHLLASEGLELAEQPSAGRLSALAALAHVAGARKQPKVAVRTMERAWSVFETLDSPREISDFSVPEWRLWTALIDALRPDGRQ